MTRMLALDAVNRDDGTIVVFEGFDPTDRKSNRYLVAVDHRLAQEIADAIGEGEAPVCAVESWQIIGQIMPKIALN